jgi:7-cyano-7-deazaguanine synthase
MNRKTLVLHSGGMDSTVCLLLAKEQGREVVSLGIDYGQKSRAELQYAIQQCRKRGIERKVINVAWDKPERTIPADRSLDQIRREMSSAFLPGRNAVFLTLGCAEAVGIGASEVWIGVNSVDYSGYPDCRPEFVEEFQKMISLAIPRAPQIVAPLVHMSKPEIAEEAARLGLVPGDTWSCYRPAETINGFEPCGRCDACVLHEYAWRAARKAMQTSAKLT